MSTTINPTAPEAVQEEGKKRREKQMKPLYPLPEGVKVKVTPEDFNPETQRMLGSQFEDRGCFLDHKATILERKAAAIRAEAEAWRKDPTAGRRTKSAKLLSRLEKLESKLKELGVNIDDLFSDDASE